MEQGKDFQINDRVALKKAIRKELYCMEPPFPYTNFLLELSNACNHECIFCAHQKMKRPIGRMSLEMANKVLKEAFNLGTREVGFYATGEPFLTNDLPKFIKLAKDIGYTYTYLTSNGSLATPQKAKEVLDAGLDSIKFSINAPERKMYEFIHGKDDFDKVVDNLKYINLYRKETNKNFKIYVTGILTKYTENMKHMYYEKFNDLCDQIAFKNVYNQGGYMPEIEYLLKCDCDKETHRVCNLPFDAICVTCEGYLSVENADFDNMLIVGDLNKESLKDAWYGSKMKMVRKMFMDDDLHECICDCCIHHNNALSKPLSPEYATINDERNNDLKVRTRIKKAGYNYSKLVYVPMSADIIHVGHINILKEAQKYGRVMVGLFSDDAIKSYKKPPLMTYEQRKIIIESIKYVTYVVEQKTKDYSENLIKYKPEIMIHGTDWREGPLSSVREKAINLMKEWDGEVIEPEYTKGVSSSMIKNNMKEKGNK